MADISGGSHVTITDLGYVFTGPNGDGSTLVHGVTTDGTSRWRRTLGLGAVEVLVASPDMDRGLVVAGTFTEPVDFGGGHRTPCGPYDMFILALDSEGAHRWDTTICLTDFSHVTAIAASARGVVIAGSIRGVGRTSDGSEFGTEGSNSSFLAGFTPSGTFAWFRRLLAGGGNLLANFQIADVTAHPNGDLWIVGGGASSIPPVGEEPTFVEGAYAWVARLDPGGHDRWARVYPTASTLTGRGSSRAQAVAIDDSGDAFITGITSGTIDLGGGSRIPRGDADAFLLALDGDGTYRWDLLIGGDAPGSESDQGRTIAVGRCGDVFLGGQFSGRVDFGGGTRISAGSFDGFIASFGEDGRYRWDWVSGDERTDSIRSVAVHETIAWTMVSEGGGVHWSSGVLGE